MNWGYIWVTSRIQHSLRQVLQPIKKESELNNGVFFRNRVHKDGFQVADEQQVDVQSLAQAVHGNEIERRPNSVRSRTFIGSAQPARCLSGLTRPANGSSRASR